MATFTKEEALRYHSEGRAGKIQVVPTKPYNTQYDLSLAYSPGVAEPCLEIEKNPNDAYKYTAKNNLVGVISNGTAVLGLGNIGALAGKPVMEGKGLLFKVFADIDVFDIEVDQTDVDAFVSTVKAIAPTFGGINLEDIKAPECFEIEKRLKEELDIPVFHDDQHGTAIISAAGLLNALTINKKDIKKVRVVVNGAGASAISCTKLYISLGVNPQNVLMVDSKGVISSSRTDLNKYKQEFAVDTDRKTLEEAMEGADIFLGLSKGNILSKEMVRSMAKDPIVFAMANPTPEISYDDAMDARGDIIFATGRSDYPNQVNNVLGFPFIFRGALDVKASKINEEMKMAAVYALADLAKQDVPEKVTSAYDSANLTFGRQYIIPKPVDPRLITEVAPAVAKAAIDSGVAREGIEDWEAYKIQLMKQMGLYNKLVYDLEDKAKRSIKTIVFTDAEKERVLKAVNILHKDKLVKPVLLGDRKAIVNKADELSIELAGIEIVDMAELGGSGRCLSYAKLLHDKRQRKGLTLEEAKELLSDKNYVGVMMVESGDVDGFVAGYSTKYSNTIRPAMQIVGSNNTLNHIAGMYVVFTKRGPYFFSDTTVNFNPSSRKLVDTTLLTANEVRKFNIEPKIAMVSYSNFGAIKEGSPKNVREAVGYLHREYPELIVDGEMQANYAFNKELRDQKFPFSKLVGKEVNTIIFPNLSSGNIAYKMMQELGETEIIGPILLGIRKPINVVQMGCSVQEIVNMALVTAIDAQTRTDEVIKL
jgi:malate dehydrogenase (oxaloacetate-decarboxylating)(NADP+)